MAEDPTQLELFEECAVLEHLRKELVALKRRCDQLRRGTSSRYNKLAKLCLSLQEENMQLKKRLENMEKGNSKAVCPEETDFFCSVK